MRAIIRKSRGWYRIYVLDWVKKGDLTMKIGKMNCNPADFWTPQVKENWQANIGKYKIDKNNNIVDAKTARGRRIKGLPLLAAGRQGSQVPRHAHVE